MGVVNIKILKPNALKIKEMRLEILNGLRKAAKEVTKDFKETTKTWNHQPKFETVIALGKTKAEFLVDTSDEIYGYVNDGTQPHRIEPVNAKRLSFVSGSRAKTTPNILGSTAGARGSRQVYSMGVNHPGTKARNFSKLIHKKHTKRFKEIMHEAMRRAREKSGHKI